METMKRGGEEEEDEEEGMEGEDRTQKSERESVRE